MKKNSWLIFFLFPLALFSQSEKYPVFKACEQQDSAQAASCFYEQTKTAFFNEFKLPEILVDESFKGTVNAVFVVTNTGNFKLIYVNSPYKELEQEVNRTFEALPKITPAMYNNHAVEMRFELPLKFPISDVEEPPVVVSPKKPNQNFQEAVDNAATKASQYNEYNSQLNIPFNQLRYIDYEYAINKVDGAQTTVKPYTYSYVSQFIDLAKERNQYLKPEKSTWLGRKLWNEHLLSVTEKDYWFTVDFLVDAQFGKDNSDVSFTYNNSRIIAINGGLGDKFSFSSTIYESQARFAGYINDFIGNRSNTFKPAFSEGLVPGRGKAKGFGSTAFDYPVAEGYFSYTPNTILQFQFGQGKNFIGDGYRSLLLSDASAPMPFFKMNVKLWKFNYTNIWMWGTDVRAPVVVNNAHARKYIAAHYLNIDLTKKLNLGFFETAISKGDQGFDVGFLNPLILYRTVEFSRGEDAGNALIGFTAKYKLKQDIMLYSQLVIDEFSFAKIGNLGYWGNKLGAQLGAKYFNAFKVNNLFLQGELNIVRPYTYSHRDPVLNYGNYSQPLAHPWGANFWEANFMARYKIDRITASARFVFGQKGFDPDDTINYGSNIYKEYTTRVSDYNNEVGQGNKATIFIADLQARYLINPANNMSLFSGFTYRKLAPETATATFKNENTVWFTVGLKADLFNWYLDF